MPQPALTALRFVPLLLVALGLGGCNLIVDGILGGKRGDGGPPPGVDLGLPVDNGPFDGGIDGGPDNGPLPPGFRRVAQPTSGGGTATSAGFRLQVGIGAPAPVGQAAGSGEGRLIVGPAAAQP